MLFEEYGMATGALSLFSSMPIEMMFGSRIFLCLVGTSGQEGGETFSSTGEGRCSALLYEKLGKGK